MYERVRDQRLFSINKTKGRNKALGRRIFGQAAGNDRAKHLKSPTTRIAQKGDILYNTIQTPIMQSLTGHGWW